jgi:hypothetical protein
MGGDEVLLQKISVSSYLLFSQGFPGADLESDSSERWIQAISDIPLRKIFQDIANRFTGLDRNTYDFTRNHCFRERDDEDEKSHT